MRMRRVTSSYFRAWAGFWLLGSIGGLSAAPVPREPASTAPAAWARAYATLCDNKPCADQNPRYAGADIKWDPHFAPLLRAALPQTQGWWTNAASSRVSVREAVMAFLGIPDREVRLTEGRYLTVSGCVPHACTTKGMLWIDTAAQPATVVFVGEELVAGQQRGESGYHVLIYTSRPMSTYVDTNSRDRVLFPADFVTSFNRWYQTNLAKSDSDRMLLITAFSPDNRSHDYLPDDLLHQLKYVSSATQHGAKP